MKTNALFSTLLIVFSSVFCSAQWNKLPLNGGVISSVLEANNTLYAGTYAGVYSSPDMGITWDHIAQGLPRTADLEFPNDVKKVIATSSAVYGLVRKGGLFRLENSAWVSVKPAGIYAIQEVEAIEDTIYFFGYTPELKKYLYRTVDEFNSYTVIDELQSNESFGNFFTINGLLHFSYKHYSVTPDVLKVRKAGGSIEVIPTAAFPDYTSIHNLTSINGVLFACAGSATISKIYYQAGTVWQKIVTGQSIDSGAVRGLFHANNTIMAVVETGPSLGLSLYRSGNGMSWVEVDPSGMNINYINELIPLSANEVIAATDDGIYSSTNDGATWTNKSPSLSAMTIGHFFKKGSSLFASTPYNGMVRSDDMGANWQIIKNGLPQHMIVKGCLPAKNNLVLDIKKFTKGHTWLYKYQVYISKDNGGSWTLTNEPSGYTFEDLMGTNDSSIFMYGNGPGLNNCLLRSTNNGVSWQDITAAIPDTFLPLGSLEGNGQELVLFCFNGSDYTVVKSVDNGNTFTSVKAGLPNWMNGATLHYAGKNFYIIDPTATVYKLNETTWSAVPATGLDASYIADIIEAGEKLYISTDKGVSYSSDQGQNWVSFKENLDETVLYSQLVPLNNKLFLSSVGNGIWATDVLLHTPSISQRGISAFTYPNPAATISNVLFHQGKAGIVSIDLFNLNGQLIRTLLNEELLAGTHSYAFSIEDLPAGFYSYRITTDITTNVKLVISR